ncbi:MAG: NUDIX hydrolase [Bacilli bacterium]|nr:NUDIX hydrolase [Bacilli bacterium]
MKLKKLEKIYEGKFLTYYIADFETKLGHIKKYEFISRDKNLDINNFGKNKPAGVGMVCYSMDEKKVLLQQEFRLATNHVVYNFPAGLIDEGETALEAAKREIKEETGVDLVECIAILSPSYASQGTSDELMQIVICKCEGEIKDSTFEDEEIHAAWYTKEEIKKLLDEGAYMSVRTQMFLWQWVTYK